MPDQEFTQDPQDLGTTVETAPAPVDDPGATTAEGAPSGAESLPPEFWERLDRLDPKTIPQKFLDKWVAKSDFTRKTQESAERLKRLEAERDTLYQLARRFADEKAGPAGPSPAELRKKELQELADAGDAQAQQALLDLKVEERMRPIQSELAFRTATEAARSNPVVGPVVTQHWPEIVQELRTNPHLAKLASIENHAFAETVMVGLGLEHQVREQAANLTKRDEEITALKAKIASLEKERNLGIPPSTSKAGTTSGAAPQSAFKSDRDSMLDAWVRSGHRAEDFR